MLHEAKSLGTITHKHTQSSDPEHSQGRQKEKYKEAEEGKDDWKRQVTEYQGTSTPNPHLQMGKMRPRTVKCLTRRHYAFFNMNKTRKDNLPDPLRLGMSMAQSRSALWQKMPMRGTTAVLGAT